MGSQALAAFLATVALCNMGSLAFVHPHAPIWRNQGVNSVVSGGGRHARPSYVECSAVQSKEGSVSGGGSGRAGMPPVVLGPYKDGAIRITVKRRQITDAEVDAVVQAAEKKRYKLVPVRFVEEGGTRMGHTVICDWKATYLKGGSPEHVAKHKLRPGLVLPGADLKGFTLELKEDQQPPLDAFARAVATGMGQMETKMFEVTFPDNVRVEAWRGVVAKIMLLVRSINRKEDLPEDSRPLEERRAEVRKELATKAEQEADADVMAAFKAALLESCEADTDRLVNAVSWAQFGEKSLKDFKWQLIQDAIAQAEGMDFHDVPAFLKAQNKVEFVAA